MSKKCFCKCCGRAFDIDEAVLERHGDELWTECPECKSYQFEVEEEEKEGQQ